MTRDIQFLLHVGHLHCQATLGECVPLFLLHLVKDDEFQNCTWVSFHFPVGGDGMHGAKVPNTC